MRRRYAINLALGFLVGGLFLWLALREVHWGALLEGIKRADYRWLPPLVLVALFSHLLRAWRWQMLLKPLGLRPHVGRAFASIMIGYMCSYAIPRIGEVVRAAHLARLERASFSAVLGTVAMERLLDVLVLLLALGSVLGLYVGRWPLLGGLWREPTVWLRAHWPLLLAIACGFALGVLLVWRWYRSGLRVGPLRRFLGAFGEGLRSVRALSNPAAFWASTALMWACYALMTYLPFHMFGLGRLDLLDAWVLMTLASVGVVLPSPGGTGTYHFFAQQTLMLLFSVDRNTATLYAVITHGAQLVAYVLIGWAALLWTGLPILPKSPAALAVREANP
ncbi:MAG: flippase-like domain-containing protein [Bacteroidetes bacterium]|nr:flippase-like domain-containing protein [Rhodothermia bacterium]MCS7154480.1 flippase-like domain-containing protein [Bacteroidota bacterium]MCX7906853.1 flippase-like domain-containing protein [Bacteroidota bacterium]MDW8136868.1 lysylphosphatidylglycerol synthase transmembrane domain-containing protein [Bacteroidota bacterium]MDW8285262.1 lysylphosphatidylglycerol synthase transmembrane domain-containing protein [Bacteroidota bacterium]